MVAESTEMYNCYLFYVKNLKWNIMPGRNWSEDESKSKKKEIRALDLQLTTYIL